MEIMVLADGTTFGPLDGCSIHRVPDGASAEEVEDLLARGGGDVVARFERGRDVAGPAESTGERERRSIQWPGRVWLADVTTEGPYTDIEVFFPKDEGFALSIERRHRYFADDAVRPLVEALAACVDASDLDGERASAARHALARFRAMTGERHR